MPLVSWRTEGKLTELKLNRPQALNAMSWAMAGEFKKACAEISREKSAVVVVSGEGSTFSAGGDLAFIEENRKLSKPALKKRMETFYRSFLAVRDLPQVTVAKVHGTAVGAGLCLAMACDLRTVVAEAKLGFNFVRLGLNPGMAAWPLARAAFGDALARRLLMEARFFTGADLHEWGASSALAYTAEDLDQKTAALAAELAGHSRLSMRLLKEETRIDDLSAYLRKEASGQADCFKAPDIAEGVAAIREKRPPRFG
jgi:enoyl-CoA hydratase